MVSVKPGALADVAFPMDPVRIHNQAEENHEAKGQKHNQAGLLLPDFSEKFQGIRSHFRFIVSG